MSTNIFKSVLCLFIFLGITPFIAAQSADGDLPEPLFSKRITWREGRNTLRYQIEIEKYEDEVFSHVLREFTESPSIEISLPQGDYRLRIIPHDILDRPARGTEWLNFEVRPDITAQAEDLPEEPEPAAEEQLADIGRTGVEEMPQPVPLNKSFTTIGVSVGTTFNDPLVILSIHGTVSIFENLFAEIGMDAGFLTSIDDVESYYSLYPYANLGVFFPLGNRSGYFFGAGAGYMMYNYSFSYGDAAFNVFAANVTAGLHLNGFFNIVYTLRTDFASVNNRLTVGVVHRMKQEGVKN